MESTEIKRVLLNSLTSLDHRNWESQEKNNRAAELVRRIRSAVSSEDKVELDKLAVEMKQFTSLAFTLFERLRRLTREDGDKKWSKPEDNETWATLVTRMRLVVERRDTGEVVQIAERIVAFLRQRNGHDRAKWIDEAIKLSRGGRR